MVSLLSNENDISRAFVYVSNEKKMYELKPLENNLAGESSAEAISDNGKVVAGYVQGDNNETIAVLWKLNYTPGPVIPLTPVDPPKPIGPEISNPVDVNKTRQSLSKMAGNSDQIPDLYQTALYNLADSRCQMGSDSYCVGLFTQYDSVQVGLFYSYRW